MSLPDPATSDVEMRAWAALLQTTAIVQQAADRELRRAVSLTSMQFEILLRIAEAADDSLRMTDIADRLVVSRSGLTYQVTQLETRGLLTREATPDDERVVLVRLTEDGLARVREGIPHYAGVVKSMLLDRLSRENMLALTDILGDIQVELRRGTRSRG
jgi:DNA-binding MarR family transcriptional regulator